jgi:WD40 repeat protein
MKTWLSRRGEFLATTKEEFGRDRRHQLLIVELGTGKQVSAIDIGQEDAQDVAWSGDDRLVAISTWTGVSVRERETGKVLSAITAPNIRELGLSHDGKLLATSLNGFVRLWDVATGKERPTERHAGGITSIVYSPDGGTLATTASDQTVRLWSVAGAKQIASLGVHASTPYSPAFLAGGKQLATIDGEKGIRIWDATNGKEVRSIPVKFQSGAGPIAAGVLAVSRDEKKAAVYWHDRGGWLLIVDLESGKTLAEGTSKGLLDERTMESHSKFTFSADGKTLVSGGWGPTVVVWNAETAKPWFKFAPGSKVSAGPTFSVDGRILTGGEDGAVRSWDAATGKPASALQVTGKGMASFAFSPDGSVVATWGWDWALKFWDWSTGKELRAPIPNQQLQIHAMTFSPDGKTLAVGGADGTILLADVPNK